MAALGALALLVAVFRTHRPGRTWLVELVATGAFWSAAVALFVMPTGTFAAVALRAPAGGLFHPRFLPSVLGVSWLVAANLFARRRPRGRRWLDRLALVLIAGSNFRVGDLFDAMAIHHWSAYFSPVLVVRHGGWLLWDTPSQYGFLSTLAIASMPFQDPWQGFFVLNVVLRIASGVITFAVFRAWRGTWSWGFALVAALAFTLWVPGWNSVLVTPSAGPMRFIWVELLLVVLWRYQRSPSERVLQVGTGLWVAGCLWSAESMFYVSVAWLPPYAWLAARGRARLWVPPVALGLVLAGLCALYGLRLHAWPDVRAFFEYVVAFRHFYSASIAPDGSVWLLGLVMGLAATVLAFAPSPLTLGVAGACWAVGSYFVGNCNEITVTNLLATLGLVLALVGWVAIEHADEAWSVVVRLGVATVVVVVVAMEVLGNRWLNAGALDPDAYVADVTGRRPFMADGLRAALRDAGVEPGARIAFLLTTDPGPGFAWTPWLPFGSTVSLMPISAERQKEYFARYLARHPSPAGWLVEPAREANAPWLRSFLEERYAVAADTTAGEWHITRYERRPP